MRTVTSNIFLSDAIINQGSMCGIVKIINLTFDLVRGGHFLSKRYIATDDFVVMEIV